MKVLCKFILFAILMSSCNSLSNTNKQNCKITTIKYLSTYLGSNIETDTIAGYNTNLKTAKEMASMNATELKSAYFFIPIIINDISKFYSNSTLSENEKKILIEYGKIFKTIFNDSKFEITKNNSKKQICDKINAMIKKYHTLCEDDNQFYKMIYTLDDGPFYGFNYDNKLQLKNEISFDKFKLIIRGDEAENTLELIDKNNKLKWRKLIARDSIYKIKTLSFIFKPVQVSNDLGYEILLNGDGEIIHLYLKKNGDFKLFFHSW